MSKDVQPNLMLFNDIQSCHFATIHVRLIAFLSPAETASNILHLDFK